ncbi:MAG: glycosyltransferase family 39 protein, partial [Chloroflexi bacterium]|nr:glycosyltransferase family 39 protein [Chloroflexota bacterium]
MILGRIRSSKITVIAAAAVAVVLGIFGQHRLVESQDLSSGLIVWGVAVIVFLLAIWWAKSIEGQVPVTPAHERDRGADSSMPLRTEAILFLAILAIGIFFRLYKIDTIPPGLNSDAAWNGLHAIRITNGLEYAPYIAEAWGRETMFHHVIASFQLLLGPTQLAIQLAAVTVGTATLAAFYFLVRRLAGTRLALIAMLLLSASGWHLTFSRVGWRAILVPLFIALVFFFLAKALEERRMRDFVIAGLALGLSLDTYDGARMLPFAAGALILYEIVRQPSFIKSHFLHLAAFGGAFLASFAPLGWYAYNNWSDFTFRGRTLWIGSQIEEAGSLEPLFINLKNALLMYNFRANGRDFFLDQPLLDTPVSVFFALGFVIALLRFRQRGYFALLAVMGFSLVVGIASDPNGNRAIGTLLPVTAFAALFLFESWRWLTQAYPRYQSMFGVALVAVLLFVTYSTYDSYLGPDRRTQAGFFPDTSVVGRYMHGIAGENIIYVAAGNWPRDTLTYFSYQGEGDPFAREYQYTTEYDQLLQFEPGSSEGTVFIVQSEPQEGIEALNVLQERFPAAELDHIWRPDDDRLIANVLIVPPGGGAAADFTAYAEPGASQRDLVRRQELLDIAGALAEFERLTGRFPDTGGVIAVGCAGGAIGELCRFQDELGVETLADARGRPFTYGYWYQSDGATFTLYAAF